MEKKERVLYLDWLRIFACLMIIAIHVSALYANLATDQGIVTVVYNIYQNIIRCGNQLFFMISGALFLSRKELDVKRLYSHNIVRILVVYFCWSSFYAADTIRKSGGASAADTVTLLLQGKYHMWLLPRMAGMYVLLPVLFAISHYKEGRYLVYYVKTFLVTLVITMFFESAAFVPEVFCSFGQSLLPEFCQDAGYMILGYWITTIPLEKIKKRYMLLGYLLALMISLACDGRGLIFEALFLLAFMRKWNPGTERVQPVVSYIATCTLGIILLHVFVLEHFEAWFHVNLLSWNPAVAVPALTGMVFVITLIPIAVMRLVPIVRKWCI